MRVRASCLALAPALVTMVLASAAAACDLEPGASHVVARLERADTLILDDGGEALLAGVLPPVAGLAVGPADVSWPPADESRRALEALAGGKTVELATGGRKFDRYGRQLVHAFVQRGTERIWVQGDLVEAGLVRAYGLPGNLACLDELLARENRARAARRGHWATGVFQDRDAGNRGALLAYRDTFQTLEGRIDSVRSVHGQVIIAFSPGGRDGVEAVLEAGSANGRGALAQVQRLAGQRVRVRGWIEVRRHLMVRLATRAMIEVLEVPAAAPPADDGNGISAAAPAPIPAASVRE